MLVEALKINPYVLRAFTSTVSLNVLAPEIHPGDIKVERKIQVGNTCKVCSSKKATTLLLFEYLITILTYTKNSLLPTEFMNSEHWCATSGTCVEGILQHGLNSPFSRKKTCGTWQKWQRKL